MARAPELKLLVEYDMMYSCQVILALLIYIKDHISTAPETANGLASSGSIETATIKTFTLRSLEGDICTWRKKKSCKLCLKKDFNEYIHSQTKLKNSIKSEE